MTKEVKAKPMTEREGRRQKMKSGSLATKTMVTMLILCNICFSCFSSVFVNAWQSSSITIFGTSRTKRWQELQQCQPQKKLPSPYSSSTLIRMALPKSSSFSSSSSSSSDDGTSTSKQSQKRSNPVFLSAASSGTFFHNATTFSRSSARASSVATDWTSLESMKKRNTNTTTMAGSLYNGNSNNGSHQTRTTRTGTSVSIVLNLNAKGVDPMVVQAVQETVDEFVSKQKQNTGIEDYMPIIDIQVHATKTKQDAEQVAKDIMTKQQEQEQQQQQQVVIPMGGDGTLTTMIQNLWDAATATGGDTDTDTDNNVAVQFPKFAYIAMGTGNALGSVIGCRIPKLSTTNKRRQKKQKQQQQNQSSIFFQKLFRRKQYQLRQLRMVLNEILSVVSKQGHNNENNESTTNGNDQSRQNNKQRRRRHVMDIVSLPLMQVTTTTTTTTSSLYNTKPTAAATTAATATTTKKINKYLCFFAGLGFDSIMLQDYQRLQEWWTSRNQNKKNNKLFTGVFGYTVTLFTRTLPKFVLPKRSKSNQKETATTSDENDDDDVAVKNPLVRITTRQPRTTYWIDHRRGDVMRSVLADDDDNNHHRYYAIDDDDQSSSSSSSVSLLYKGRAGIVAGGTAPFYGGGLRLFPFACMSPINDDAGENNFPKFHLRVGRIHPLRGVVNIPRIFAGSYRDVRDDTFGCIDYITDHVCIDILSSASSSSSSSSSFPVQHSGESVGSCTRVEMEILSSSPSSSTTTKTPAVDNNNDKNGTEQRLKHTSSSTRPRPRRPIMIDFITLLPPRLIVEEEEDELDDDDDDERYL